MANPARAYLATQVETTTQGELLIMLYEAAIKFLKRAKVEIDNKDYAKKGIYISKAMAIIHELAECLNKEKGGEITPKLSSLYQFCTSHLIKANIRMDNKMVDEVIKILEGLRSAYAQIVPAVDGKTPPPEEEWNAGEKPKAPQPPIQPQRMATPQIQPNSIPSPPVQKMAPKQKTVTSESAQSPQPTSAQPSAPEVAPEQAQKPTPPPKLKSAFNAAKFRAANAYNNNR